MASHRWGHAMLATFMLLAMSGESLAWQFSFNVPVELKDIDPRYTHLKIVCRVVDSANQEIGRFSPMLPIVNGAFNAKVGVPVNPIAGKTVADGAKYFCDLMLCTGTGDATCTNASGIPNVNQPGTPFTPGVQANIQ